MTVLCEHGATEISLPFKINKNVQTAFVQSILASIILLPLLISLLLTLLDFSPASKIHALFFSVSHELKQILSQAVTRAGDLTLLQSVQSSCNSPHVTFKYRLLLLSMYYIGCLPSMHLITQGCGKKMSNALVLLNKTQDQHDYSGLSIQESFEFGKPN